MLRPRLFLWLLLCAAFVTASPLMEPVARAAGGDPGEKAISETASVTATPTSTPATLPTVSASPVAGSESDDSDDGNSGKGLTKGEEVLLRMATAILVLMLMPGFYAYITYDPYTAPTDMDKEDEEAPCCPRVWASRAFSAWYVLLLHFTLRFFHQKLIILFCALAALVSFVLVAEGIVEGRGQLMSAALFLYFLISGFLANEEVVHPAYVTRVGVWLFLFYYVLMFICLVISIPARYISTADDNTAVVLSMLVAFWLCVQVVKNLIEGLIRHQGKWGSEAARARWSQHSDNEQFKYQGGAGGYQGPGGAGEYHGGL